MKIQNEIRQFEAQFEEKTEERKGPDAAVSGCLKKTGALKHTEKLRAAGVVL